jgi:hypothetical protein
VKENNEEIMSYIAAVVNNYFKLIPNNLKIDSDIFDNNTKIITLNIYIQDNNKYILYDDINKLHNLLKILISIEHHSLLFETNQIHNYYNEIIENIDNIFELKSETRNNTYSIKEYIDNTKQIIINGDCTLAFNINNILNVTDILLIEYYKLEFIKFNEIKIENYDYKKIMDSLSDLTNQVKLLELENKTLKENIPTAIVINDSNGSNTYDDLHNYKKY